MGRDLRLLLPHSLTFLKMCTRASASDYDDFQAQGWTTEELLPFTKKLETYQRDLGHPWL